MLSRRALTSASRLSRSTARQLQHRQRIAAPFSTARTLRAGPVETYDFDSTGGYINPPPIKRQHRDPYGDWWDKQERRNFGEPVHEDNDILGLFSLEDYTHMTPARAFLLWGGFISVVLSLLYTVSLTYPDRPSAPKEYEDGLDKELGGPGALRARKSGDEV